MVLYAHKTKLNKYNWLSSNLHVLKIHSFIYFYEKKKVGGFFFTLLPCILELVIINWHFH